MSDVKKMHDSITSQICNTAHLSNGLWVYQIPSEFSASHALLGVNYGSVNTSYTIDGKSVISPDGTAHFLEHKLFDNPSGCVDDVFTSLGASCNAYTSFSSTAYTFSCTDNFDSCLETLLHFVTTPYFTEQTVKKEQGIIGEEIKMYDDSPFWRCYFNALYGMYGDCAISRDIAGTVSSISKITADMLYSLTADFYSTENMRLCIYGGGDFDKIVKSAEKLPHTPYTAQKSQIITAPGVNKSIIRMNMETSRPMLYIGIKDDNHAVTDADRIKRSTVFQAIFTLLFSESSDFFNRMYSSGMISDRLQYDYEDESDFAFGLIGCETDKPDELFSEFVKYMDDVKKNGIDKRSFEISKRIVYADFIRSFDSGTSLPSDLLVCGEHIFDKASVLSSVTLDEANALINEFFTESSYTCSVLGMDVE